MTDDDLPGGRKDFNSIVQDLTFVGGSGVKSKIVLTDSLICNDNITEATEVFLLLMEITDFGSDIVELDTDYMGILIFNIIDDDRT